MNKLIAGACAAVMAVTSFGAATVPVTAASLQFTSDAQFMTVQYRDRDRDRNGGWERDRDRDGRRGFERRRDGVYFNGYRGSRDRRGGWRQHNGFWFPPDAFAGAIIGGIISGAINSQNNNSNNQRTARITREHLEWCEDRYRSYRASDNTFQPYNGPRQQCISPYLR